MKKAICLIIAQCLLITCAESKVWIGCNLGIDINKFKGTELIAISKVQKSKNKNSIISEIEVDLDYNLHKNWYLGGGLSVGLPITGRNVDKSLIGAFGFYITQRFYYSIKPYVEYKFNNSWSIYGVAGFSRSYIRTTSNKLIKKKNYNIFRLDPGIGFKYFVSDKVSIGCEMNYHAKKQIMNTGKSLGATNITADHSAYSTKLCLRFAL
ncbi:MAG: outer membrane beta-barrel protein [Alphaproteobacteria bacterium]|nr:outer membrane beta-barrel protein [Alphaproteobacteria bacterium]